MQLLTVKEAAAFLHLAEITVYKYVSARTLPHKKIGRRVMFTREELIEWINAKSVPPIRW